MDKPLDTQELMITAAYIVKGFFEEKEVIDFNRIPGFQTEFDMVYWLASYAPMVESTYQSMNDRYPDCCGGVWAYEVCEDLGRILRGYVDDRADLPSHEEVLTAISMLADDIFYVED